MPAPFAWIDIPGDKGTKWSRAPYKIAKYPITNAQFRLFLDADGYRDRKWWTEAGWKAREEGRQHYYHDGLKPSGKPWTEPYNWKDAKWNSAEQPVVGVSWHEAVAFCLWLSDVSGEQIMLPTNDQWQYAAQGDDGRDYTWGPMWDASRCNNNVDGKGIGMTTPVRQYEGKGDSPFGVVDMAGNVYEWCLTDPYTQRNDVSSAATTRVVRGGSWLNEKAVHFRCDNLRDSGTLPDFRLDHFGFRISRS